MKNKLKKYIKEYEARHTHLNSVVVKGFDQKGQHVHETIMIPKYDLQLRFFRWIYFKFIYQWPIIERIEIK